VLVIQHNIAVQAACGHQVRVQVGKICLRDTLSALQQVYSDSDHRGVQARTADVAQCSSRGSSAVSGRQWLLHHNNALNNTSLVVQQFLTKNNISVITQSCTLHVADLWLFPAVKESLRGHVVTWEDIK
jgi:hypothetical protein